MLRNFFPQNLKSGLVLFAIFLSSFLVRIAFISKGPYHVDCLTLIMKAQETFMTRQLQWQIAPGYPVAVLLATIFFAVGKFLDLTNPVFAVNFMGVFFSSAAAVVFYLLVERMFNKRTAFLSAMLLSFSPLFLGLSVFGLSHMPALFFLFLTLLCLSRYQGAAVTPGLIFGGLSYGLMGATREHDFLFVLPAVTFFFFCEWQEKKAKLAINKNKTVWYLVFLSIALAVVLIAHLPYLLQEHRAQYLKHCRDVWQVSVPDNFLGIWSPSTAEGYTLLISSLDSFGIISCLCGGVYLLFQRKYVILGFLFLWIIIPFAFYGNLRMTVTPRYFVIFLPAFIIAGGYFLSELYALPRWGRGISTSFFLLLIILWLARMYPVMKFRHSQAVLPDFAHWVATVTEDTAWIIATDESRFYRYYGGRKTLIRPMGFTELSQEQLVSFKRSLDKLLDEGSPVYLTSTSLYSYDWNHSFSNFMKEHYQLSLAGSRLYEDWHLGPMLLQVTTADLFCLYRK